MKQKKYRRFLWGCLLVSILCMAALFYHEIWRRVPDELHVTEAQDSIGSELDIPFVVLDDAVESSGGGSYRVRASILGVIPLKEIRVSTLSEDALYVSGSPIGIYMETDGVMVIGNGEIVGADGTKSSPASHIVEAGDYILRADGTELQKKADLTALMEENRGEEVELEVVRDEETMLLRVTPVLAEDGSYKLGLWVRDSVQGIGTLTFVKGDATFAALGHAIRDVDTGGQLKIADGRLYQTEILNIARGISGTPGELQGLIRYQKTSRLGTIVKNTENGIYGTLACGADVALKLCQVGLKQEMHTGAASLLCDLGDGVRSYTVEITKIDYHADSSNKCFEIRVTDPDLIAATGGIVQGMSGSPILQDEKVVGAVTHVFISDPERGYGIFIENMLD